MDKKQEALLFQRKILERAEKIIGNRKMLVLWMREHLGLTQAIIYRRLNGHKLLNLDELLYIIRFFELPPTELFETQSDYLYFQLQQSAPTDYETWLLWFQQDFASLCQQSNCKMYYTSTENPVFYYFQFEELTQFKLYIWAKTIWELPEVAQAPFVLHGDMWNANCQALTQKIVLDYTMLDGVEFWTPNFMSNNLNQIQYFLDSYQFEDRNDALLLCDQLRGILRHILQQLDAGHKILDTLGEQQAGSFELYYNELLHTNNTILFESEEKVTLYNTFGNPNTIKTQQPKAAMYAKTWFKKLQKRSVPMSNASERERLRLFKRMEEKINKAERLFKGML